MINRIVSCTFSIYLKLLKLALKFPCFYSIPKLDECIQLVCTRQKIIQIRKKGVGLLR